MTEHTILVAFTVDGLNQHEAEQALMARLPEPEARERAEIYTGIASPDIITSPITSWWVAEDDRGDRSDCDSAVFVDPTRQAQANRVLQTLGLQSNTGTGWGIDPEDTHPLHAKGLDRLLDEVNDPENENRIGATEEALETALDLLDSLGVYFGQVTK